MKFKYKTFTEPLVDQPIVKHVFREGSNQDPVALRGKLDHIKHFLISSLANCLAERMEFIHYKRSVVTGEKYDYTPAIDPMCESVYEARLPLFDELQTEINRLKEENKKLEKYVLHDRRGYLK
ncbi:MAG: hypothetical protein U9O94_02655 [Nanoarchaeota archaeon]|nr:hypothetical protein [Nanoarchaeota archaeon]